MEPGTIHNDRIQSINYANLKVDWIWQPAKEMSISTKASQAKNGNPVARRRRGVTGATPPEIQ